jgi:hypothetical protein
MGGPPAAILARGKTIRQAQCRCGANSLGYPNTIRRCKGDGPNRSM